MHITSQNASQEEPTPITAADLTVFAYTLRGERIPRPVREETEETRTTTEHREREQARLEREQARLGELLVQFKRRSRYRKICLRAFTATGGLAFAMGLAMLCDAGLIEAWHAPFEALALFAFLIMCLGSWLHSQMATLVANIPVGDIRAIAPLLEALHYADMQGIPQTALKELLPQLKPEDAVLFTDAHRHALNLALNDPNTDLVVLLLKALEKIGDGRSIGPVSRLANGGGCARVDSQVLRAAQHCLPLLEARAVYDTANQTLLRASALEPEKGTELLRSVAGSREHTGRDLLRPTEDTVS